MATAVEANVETLPNEPEANKLFRMVMKYKGSDLHLKVGLPPAMRLAGVLRMMQLPVLTTAEMERLMFPLLSPRQKTILRGNRRHRLRPHHLRTQRRRDPLPRQPVPPARPAQPGRTPRQYVDPQLRRAGTTPRARRDRQPRPGDHHPRRRDG